MSEKKVVGRNVAAALGLICVVLTVGLVGAIVNYTSIISGKDNTIASLNSQIKEKDSMISSLNSQIADKDSQIETLTNLKNQLQTWLQENITYYNSQINSLNAQITRLNDSYIFLNQAYQELTIKHATLSANYTQLCQKISELTANYTNLLNRYDALIVKYRELMSEYTKLKDDYRKILKAFNEPLPYKLTPTISELQYWLIYEDNTDKITYSDPNFVCGDFAVMLSQHAKLKYWDTSIVFVSGYNWTGYWFSHVFNAIICREGLVYIEPQSDTVFWYGNHEKIKEGYWYKFPDFPNYGFIYVESYIEVLLYEEAP